MLISFPSAFQSLARFHRVMDHLFDENLDANVSRAFGWTPAMNLFRADDHYVLVTELPGARKDSLNIEVRDNTLRLSGTRDDQRFERSLRLPADIDADKVSASFEAGILRVTLPETERAKPRKVAVN